MVTSKLKYIDGRHIFIPSLKCHPGGVVLPDDTNIIKVTESEKINLLNMKNGKRQCFEEIKETRKYNVSDSEE